MSEIANIKRWAGKGSLALIDQAFISGSNFLVSILLARWSSAPEYGAFAVAFAIFLLLSQFQQSVLLEPMSVFGGSYSGGRLKRYYGSLLHMHTRIAVGTTLRLAPYAQRGCRWHYLASCRRRRPCAALCSGTTIGRCAVGRDHRLTLCHVVLDGAPRVLSGACPQSCGGGSCSVQPCNACRVARRPSYGSTYVLHCICGDGGRCASH